MYTDILPISTILVGDRQRTDKPEKHYADLAKSIEENGLIHAITIQPNGALVAGFCRLTALNILNKAYYYGGQLIPAGHVPAAPTHLNSEEELYRLELEENLRRKNLSPLDEAKAIAKLHTFRKGQHSTWTEVETGLEVDELRGTERDPQVARQEVADSILMNSFAEDVEVQKAPTRAAAVRIAKKKMEQEFQAAMGQIVKSRPSDMTIVCGDCTTRMEGMAPGSFSGIVCDPPYGIDADSFGEQSMAGGHEYGDSRENALAIAEDIIRNAGRLCKPDFHLYMFCDIRVWGHLADLARKYELLPFSTPLIWYKPGLGHAPQPGYFGRRYEAILFCQRGNRKLAKSAADVFEFPAVKEKIHAAQKPVELLAQLLGLSFFPGEHILDPCAGSGSIFRAAKIAKVKATGIEISEKYANICKQIIGELQ